jgi:F-type H+-transporting ATPase subunit b
MHAVPPAEVESTLLAPDFGMAGLTWLTFFLLLAVLYRFAWKPILKALDEREALISKSLEDAARASATLTDIHQTRIRFISEAEAQAQAIIEEARKTAAEVSRVIQHRAKEEAQIILQNASREIREETEKARTFLREEGARTAVVLAGKLIEQNLDDEENRKLVNEWIKGI